MAAKKKSEKVVENDLENKVDFGFKKSRKWKILKLLFFVYLIIWILVGAFILFFIVQGIRLGMFNYLFTNKQPTASAQQGVEAPSEVDLPKIGKINVACAEKALKPESIQKLVTDYDINVLTTEEKTAFEKCVVQKPSNSPSPTPNN